MAVASEAPLTPMSRVKMKRGSSTMLSTAPLTMPTMAKRALPCRRSWLLRVSADIMKGVAATM